MWKIVRISNSWLRPSEVDVEVEPSDQIRPLLEERIRRFRITLNLRVTGDKLSIPSVTARGQVQPVTAGDSVTMFNGFACPT